MKNINLSTDFFLGGPRWDIERVDIFRGYGIITP